ncbi:MAG: spermidine/putrescine ABC transporter substrate-binding protein [Kiritimatiellae bacterium]|nr:spermidine/putrescine ABC transporter substrate-binding protein [Kiritimatiellia bacterium]
MRTNGIPALAAAAAVLLAGCGRQTRTLHVYTWSDYISPEVVEEFSREHGCRVEIDTFESNEAMYAKLKAGGTGYDIITPSSYLVSLMAREGLISELDHSKMPNVRRNFDRSFAGQIVDPEFRYNVPYAVTYTGFMYAKDRIPAGADVASWSILDSAALKGKVTLLDDMREVIGAGLMALGHSINSRDAGEIDAAVAKVLAWKRNIRKFDAESYKTEVASGATWLGHGYSTDATQVIVGDEEEGDAPRPDIGFALPREGFTIAFDEMVLSSSAPEPDLAYAFMNYLYTAEASKANMEYNKGPMPVAPGIAALDEDFRKGIILDAETLAKGQVLKSIDDDPAVKALYDRAWDRIKATGDK